MEPGSIFKKSIVTIYAAILLMGFLMIFILPPIGFIIVLLCAVLLVIYAVLAVAGAGKQSNSKSEKK